MSIKHGRRLLRKRKSKRAIRIGKVAVRLFEKKGYLQTSMNDIAAQAKLSKGGVYHYFFGKDEILYFILFNYMELILEGLEEELDKIGDNFEKIHFIISRHIKIYAENTSEAKTLLHEASCLPKKYLDVITEKERIYYRIVSNSLEEAYGRPISKEQLTALTFMLFGMCNWIYSWYNPKGQINPQELSELIYNLFIHGVKDFHQ